jgi:hypothetical protein
MDEDDALAALFWISFGFFFVALAFPAYQALLWLKDGVWHPLPISWATRHVPQTDWVGLQKIIDWTLDLPVSVLPMLVALLCFVVAYSKAVGR